MCVYIYMHYVSLSHEGYSKLCVCIYIYIYIYMHYVNLCHESYSKLCVCIYIYIFIMSVYAMRVIVSYVCIYIYALCQCIS